MSISRKIIFLGITSILLTACTTVVQNNTSTPTNTTSAPQSTSAPAETSKGSPSSSPKASDSTASWKLYSNQKEGYQIKYPPTWYAMNGFESTIGTSENYLSNENVKYTELSKNGVYLFIKRDNATQAPENNPVKNFNALYTSQTHTNIQIANTQAIKIIFENEFDAGSKGDTNKRIIRYALMHNNKIYVLEFRSKFNVAITQNESIFDSIAQTFKFTN